VRRFWRFASAVGSKRALEVDAMDIPDRVVDSVVSVILSTSGAATIMKLAGKTWLDAFISKRLEAFKHENAKELAQMKVDIDTALSGSLKLQEREFEVLQEAWSKLDEAYATTEWIAHPFQQYPDLAPMSPIELDEFMEGEDFSESQKDSLRHATAGFTQSETGRNAVYQNLQFWKRLHQAKVAIGAMHKYVSAKAPFFTPELRKQFDDLLPMLHSVVIALEGAQQFKLNEKRAEAWKKFSEEAKPAYSALNLAIKQRFISHGKTKTGA
jgi:hypothetical protein